MRLTYTADRCNKWLYTAGREERWTLDTDENSNSVGTWFCGNVGGVTLAQQMREETEKLITRAAERRGGR